MRAEEDKGRPKLNPFMVAGSLLILAAFGLLFGVVLKGSSPSNQASPALTPEPEEEIVFE
jgi:cytochrome bd-type quinol oxidase subunit 2